MPPGPLPGDPRFKSGMYDCYLPCLLSFSPSLLPLARKLTSTTSLRTREQLVFLKPSISHGAALRSLEYKLPSSKTKVTYRRKPRRCIIFSSHNIGQVFGSCPFTGYLGSDLRHRPSVLLVIRHHCRRGPNVLPADPTPVSEGPFRPALWIQLTSQNRFGSVLLWIRPTYVRVFRGPITPTAMKASQNMVLVTGLVSV